VFKLRDSGTSLSVVCPVREVTPSSTRYVVNPFALGDVISDVSIVGAVYAVAPYHSLKDMVAAEALEISARMSESLILAFVPDVPPAST
jgi:hypothetical protein